MDTDATALRNWHLRYRYDGGEWLKAAETHGLRREHRGIVLEVLRRHFEQREPGHYQFDYLDPATLPALQRARPKPGPLESGSDAERYLLAIRTTAHHNGEFSDEQRRAILVRDVARMIEGEIRSLDGGDVLRQTGRDDLIAHLMGLATNNPALSSNDPAVFGAANRGERDAMAQASAVPPANQLAQESRGTAPPNGTAPTGMPRVTPAAPAPAEPDEPAGPSLTRNQQQVMLSMARQFADGHNLLSPAVIAAEMLDEGNPLSARSIGPIVRRFIRLGYAERPQGSRSGARLTTKGRLIASKIAD